MVQKDNSDSNGSPDKRQNYVDISHDMLRAVVDLKGIEDTRAFLNSFKNVEYGWTAEEEFTAIIAWLGKCAFAHRLEQRPHLRDDQEPIQVPDLFVQFEQGGKELKAFVEVKSTEDLTVRWRPNYHNKLKRYGDMFGLPVLLAWKVRLLGLWVLVDPNVEGLVPDGQITFETAVKHSLMGVVAGDFCVVPKVGLGFHFRANIEEEFPDGTVRFKITSAHWGARHEALEDLSPSIISLLIAAASKEYAHRKGNTMYWGVTTQDLSDSPQYGSSGLSAAQQLLRTLVGWATKESEDIRWRHVLEDLNNIISAERMISDITDDIGRAVQYVFHLQPQIIPPYVPQEWHLPPPSS